jgi:hypothetical protein
MKLKPKAKRRKKQMAKIMDNLEKAHVAVVIDTFKGGNLGVRIAALAIRAVNGGLKSQDWKNYMSLFADNEEQLNLLTTDQVPADKPWLERSRAYMVSNAVCDAATTTETGFRVDTDIDTGIAEAHEAAIAALRPFQIPDVNV